MTTQDAPVKSPEAFFVPSIEGLSITSVTIRENLIHLKYI